MKCVVYRLLNRNLDVQQSKRFYTTGLFKPIPKNKTINVLGIETSCDDTGVAIVNSDGRILSRSLLSNPQTHNIHGGIHPPSAARDHRGFIHPVLNKAFQDSGLESYNQIDAVAVTIGPGLKSSLRVGIGVAKEISLKYRIPLVPVNHLLGHALTVRILNNSHHWQQEATSSTQNIEYPFLSVIVSGGHSQFLVCKGVGDWLQLGGTLDDSIGEAFDKTARAIGLTWEEGGKGLEQLSLKGDPNKYEMPIPLRQKVNCDLSFSGMKSHIQTLIDKLTDNRKRQLTDQEKYDIAASFQLGAVTHIQRRLRRGLQWCSTNLEYPLTSMVVSGGVARNQQLRKTLDDLGKEFNLPVHFPPLDLCTDNGVMIAWAGIEMIHSSESSKVLYDPEEIAHVKEINKWPIASNDDIFNTSYPDPVKYKRRGLRINMFQENKSP